MNIININWQSNLFKLTMPFVPAFRAVRQSSSEPRILYWLRSIFLNSWAVAFFWVAATSLAASSCKQHNENCLCEQETLQECKQNELTTGATVPVQVPLSATSRIEFIITFETNLSFLNKNFYSVASIPETWKMNSVNWNSGNCGVGLLHIQRSSWFPWYLKSS